MLFVMIICKRKYIIRGNNIYFIRLTLFRISVLPVWGRNDIETKTLFMLLANIAQSAKNK